ncbi:MAG: aminopeptidase N [Gammaproteobacteria bacterium]|nr:MAG: aminopeptidase N [Gammaproteobacteria bacterium]
MKEGQPQAVYLKDYTPPHFFIDQVYLDFELGEEVTVVTSHMQIRCNPDYGDASPTLDLHGEDQDLQFIELDEVRLSAEQYSCSEEALLIPSVPKQFSLIIQTQITPQTNTSLEGLYKSSGNFCTQCEAQGFRKITYFLDRPDVMSKFTVRLQADKSRYPVLLSNGNLKEEGVVGDQHFAVWEDPFPKPSYLFALVAGDLVFLEGSHRTTSGKDIVLRIYTEEHNADKCEHALRSLQKAMQWDEQRFGLECDLDIYMIVAVDDFNMGAMENKGLNIFNSSCVLARPDTSTDAEFMHIEAVVAHEYFHNWTGNRVTCRDWFQLSLKEGLTVFRDQEFTSDVTSRAVKRIDDVRSLRAYQFAEDASPMAHPIRPASFMEISNFYTLTVYEKGAEVVRMYQTMFGVDGFRKGMDLYFQRHDGQAVTTDDFAAAMADANNADLTKFKRWYAQAGTPVVKVKDRWDATTSTYEIECEQSCPATSESSEKLPFVIPLKTSLLRDSGEILVESQVLSLTEHQQTFKFQGIDSKPVPDLLQEFSAPVQLQYSYSNEQLAFLLKHSPDSFNRWNAGNRLAVNVLLENLSGDGQDSLLVLQQALEHSINSPSLDQSLLVELLMLPNEKDLEQHIETVDMRNCVNASDKLVKDIAKCLEVDLLSRISANIRSNNEYSYNSQEMARRRLINVCLQILCKLDKPEYRKIALEQYQSANNMTEQLGAINALIHSESEEREQVLSAFEKKWQHDSLVMDKWFAMHARSKVPNALETVKALMQHPLFTMSNPNKVRSLVGVFAGQNAYHFHNPDGSGYEFVTEQVIHLNDTNPQIASRLVRTLMRWRNYANPCGKKMCQQLERIAKHKTLSKDVFEIVSKSLKA